MTQKFKNYKTIKPLEDNIGENLDDPGFGSDCLVNNNKSMHKMWVSSSQTKFQHWGRKVGAKLLPLTEECHQL